ncbi:MAG: hypothetical protein JSS30_04635 [Verrucomicrobia bacterium]|nr:hypothetical protein [Verrucomicrobiota bacterium]
MAVEAKYTDSSARLDILDYNSKIQEYSLGEVSSVSKVLKKLELPSSAFVCTSGTAGKLELTGAGNEPIRLCVVCDRSDLDDTSNKVGKCVSEQLKGNFRIEWRDPSHPVQIDDKCFPSHFIHQILLSGDPTKVDELYYQFVKEVQELPGEMRQKFRKHFVANHLGQLSQVVSGVDSESVDLNKGVIAACGLKHSLLLPIQYVLDLRIIDAIRVLGHWPKDYVSFLKLIPKAIPELIDYMYQERLLPELSMEDVQDLQNAYRLGLFYCQNGEVIQCTDPERIELQEAYDNTHRILGKIDSGQFCKTRGTIT